MPTRRLVTGGARSGKSSWAEQQLADRDRVDYVATSHWPDDPDWAERVRLHRERRPASWSTIETIDLVSVLASQDDAPVLIDCLGVWLTRVMDETGVWEQTPGADNGRRPGDARWAPVSRRARSPECSVGDSGRRGLVGSLGHRKALEMTGRRRPAERRWGLITATGLFTVIPVPPRDEITSSDAEAAINWLPALGALIGSAAGVLGWLTFWFGGSPFLGAVVCVGLFALITGGLHLDGLADTMDALASRKPREAALAIMKRSDIGPMGVLAILFAVLFQVAGVTHVLAVGSLGQVIAVCALAGVIGRLAVVGACASPDSARSGGFGDIFVGVMSPIQVGAISLAAAFAVVAAATVWTNPVGFYAAALISVAVVAIQHRRLSKRFGGMTGDLFGCLIESGQTFVIVFACLSI